MISNKLVLVREPAESGRENIAHLIRETDGIRHALCSPREKYPYEGRKLSRAKWIVRCKQEHDSICSHCQRSLEALDRPEKPPVALPCTRPDAPVALWMRRDGGRGVLVHSCAGEDALKSRCGVKNPRHDPERWWPVQPGKAREITCSLCLRAEGLYKGRPRQSEHVQTLLDDWLAFTGEYHRSDPRKKEALTTR
jgi:hypothetical protein